MNAWKYIGRCITVMDHLYQIAENILVRIHLHTQVCAIRIEGADHHADGHTDKQEGAQPEIILLICKKEIQNCAGNIKKPDHVRNDKVLTKRNHIVQCHMHDLVIVRDHALQPEEIWKIQKNVAADPDMSVFF